MAARAGAGKDIVEPPTALYMSGETGVSSSTIG